MTTIVTRLFRDAETAHGVAAALRGVGVPAGDIEVLAGADATAARMEAARVNPASAAAYAARCAEGPALVVVRAGFQPIGCAAKAMQLMDSRQPVPSGVANENEYIRESPRSELFARLSILADHALMFGRDGGRTRGTMSEAFRIPILSNRVPNPGLVSGFMSTRIVPMALLSQRKNIASAIPGGKLMTDGVMPAVSRRLR